MFVFCIIVCLLGGGGGKGREGFKDMKTGEECAEEVVQCNYKSVCPVLAEEDLEGGVLLWVLSEGKSCVCECV